MATGTDQLQSALHCSHQANAALGPLIPEMSVAKLIGVAWRNYAEHEVEIHIDGNAPNVIRE